jgi:hypothetical protein
MLPAACVTSCHVVSLILLFSLIRQNPVDGEQTWFFGDSWSQMYLVDPEPSLSPAAAGDEGEGYSGDGVTAVMGRALGGEISMWTEQADDLNIEAQMWPRAAAAAERLWSVRDVTDLAAATPRLSAWWVARGCAQDRYGVTTAAQQRHDDRYDEHEHHD